MSNIDTVIIVAMDEPVNILRGWLTNAQLVFQRGKKCENFLSPAVKYFSSC